MKRILFCLMMMAAAVSGAFAITPREAFNRISQLTGMNTKQTEDISIDSSRGYALRDVSEVSAFTGSNNLDLQILDIASQITPGDRLIGAYNPMLSAEVYTCPNSTGQYDYLLLVYGKDGALYGCQLATIDEGTRNLIAHGTVHLHDQIAKIQITPDVNLVNIW
ncbi:MAG: hypothetical protein K2I56_02130 [Muribaculaceae bacterium]|nr:hypothetical protein [Muribaculaceae bacterium]